MENAILAHDGRMREAPTPEAANDLLKQGFVLVKVMEKYTNDTDRQFSNIVYVLGRQRFNGESHPASAKTGSPINQPAPPTIDAALLDKRPWKEYANGGGEWTFYMDRKGPYFPTSGSQRVRSTGSRLARRLSWETTGTGSRTSSSRGSWCVMKTHGVTAS